MSDGQIILDSVRSILFSGRPDEAISGELAELLGFDELDLVSDILSNRNQFFEKLGVIDEPTLAPLPPKGKVKEIGNSSLDRNGRSCLSYRFRSEESCTRSGQAADRRATAS